MPTYRRHVPKISILVSLGFLPMVCAIFLTRIFITRGREREREREDEK